MNLITGDSHTNFVIFDNSSHLLCSGGTAKGLNNPQSISQYNNTIIQNVQNNNYKHLFFLFGGVDVDFSFIHKYLENPSINYMDFNLDVIKNYLEFITKNFHNKSVIILYIGLPTLDDKHIKTGLLNGHINYLENQDLSILSNKLSQINLPNIFDRTKIALNFNEQLQNEINKLGLPNIRFLDITTFTYDFRLHRIKDMFFTRNDHHNGTRNKFYTGIINKFLLKIN